VTIRFSVASLKLVRQKCSPSTRIPTYQHTRPIVHNYDLKTKASVASLASVPAKTGCFTGLPCCVIKEDFPNWWWREGGVICDVVVWSTLSGPVVQLDHQSEQQTLCFFFREPYYPSRSWILLPQKKKMYKTRSFKIKGIIRRHSIIKRLFERVLDVNKMVRGI
jgi:hypothetical protein